MKKIILTLTLIHSILLTSQIVGNPDSSQSNNSNQETIVPLENRRNYILDEPNMYYKDLNNRLDNFVGNWIYDDGVHYLKIIISKHTRYQPMFYSSFNAYEDILMFSVLYKENGIEKYTIPSQRQMMSFMYLKSKYIVRFHYDEPTLTNSCKRGKSSVLELEYNPSSIGMPLQDPNATLNWSLVLHFPERKFCTDGTLTDVSDFLIPNNITLHRE